MSEDVTRALLDPGSSLVQWRVLEVSECLFSRPIPQRIASKRVVRRAKTLEGGKPPAAAVPSRELIFLPRLLIECCSASWHSDPLVRI